MSYDDSISNLKIDGSKITPTWMNNIQNALGGGNPAQSAKFVVFYDATSGFFKARNGATGAITYEDADFIDVVNPALLGCASGGRVHISQNCTGAVFATPIKILQDATWLTLESGTSLLNTGAGDGIQVGDATHTVYYSGVDGGGGSWINRTVSGATYGVHVYDAHVWEVRNLTIQNHATAAFYAERAWEGRILNCHLKGSGSYALKVYGIAGNQTNQLLVGYSWMQGGTVAAVDISSSGVGVSSGINTNLFNCGISDALDGVVDHDSNLTTIQNCYLEANTGKNIYLKGDVAELKAPRVIRNFINILDAADYGVYIDHCADVLVQENLFTRTGAACTAIHLTANATNATVWPNHYDIGCTNTYANRTSLKVNAEHQISILAGSYAGELIDNAGYETSGASVFTFDPDLYPPIISIKYRAMKWPGVHPGGIWTKLYCTTHAADVAGSQTSSTYHSSWENVSSGDLLAEFTSGSHDYCLMYAMDTENGYIGRVTLIVQTN